MERNDRVELTCIYCGFLLSVEDEPILSIDTPTSKGSSEKLNHVLVTDDSKFTRRIIKDLLMEKDLADVVLEFENGLELTSAFAKLIAEGKSVDVAIIDINMPVMDGLTAAKIIRSIESQNGIPRMPIAFFSSVKADDNLRNQMDLLAPANYVNKGADPDPDKLAERVEHLLSYFMQMIR
ncbi:MAG TPA: response regulator [Nitrospirae bacterium]|nr:response regulator [Nitrospirota bacterium]